MLPRAAAILLWICVAGCNSHHDTIPLAPPHIIASSGLPTTITADTLSLTRTPAAAVASAELVNQQRSPVTLRYRFFFYNHEGLDVLPFTSASTITLAGHCRTRIAAQAANSTVKQVRLYLYQ